MQSIEEMLKPKGQVPWGNRVGFLPLKAPKMGKLENPLEFVKKAKLIIDRNKMSLGVFYNFRLGKYIARVKGPEVGLTD